MRESIALVMQPDQRFERVRGKFALRVQQFDER
jgi:hypothetical protein